MLIYSNCQRNNFASDFLFFNVTAIQKKKKQQPIIIKKNPHQKNYNKNQLPGISKDIWRGQKLLFQIIQKKSG